MVAASAVSSLAAEPAGARARSFAWIALAAVFTLVLYAIAAGALGPSTPLISEDWAQLVRMRAVPSLSAALSLAREPMRPFQHTFFWLLDHSGLDPAGSAINFVARAPGSLFHIASIALAYALARGLGSTRATASFAAVLFALYPNVKSVAWPSAIGSPGRVMFELVALNLLVRQAREPSLPRGIGAVLAMLIAMGFHESGFLTPILLCAVTFGSGSTIRDGVRRLVDRMREPTFAMCVAIAIGYAVYMAFLREQRYNQAKSPDALPANIIKASLALVPEIVRLPTIEGLRGNLGVLGYAFGALALVAVFALWLAMLRAGPPLRAAALAIVVELALPAVGVGFAQRHAYLAPVWLAIGAAQWLALRPSRVTAIVVIAWGALWGYDSVRDAVEIRAGGRCARQLMELARDERRSEKGEPIAIVDAPDATGSERDVPLFNWGLPLMFAAYGVEGPWLYWRTYEFLTPTEFERIAPDTLDRAVRTGRPRLIRWDKAAKEFRRE